MHRHLLLLLAVGSALAGPWQIVRDLPDSSSPLGQVTDVPKTPSSVPPEPPAIVVPSFINEGVTAFLAGVQNVAAALQTQNQTEIDKAVSSVPDLTIFTQEQVLAAIPERISQIENAYNVILKRLPRNSTTGQSVSNGSLF